MAVNISKKLVRLAAIRAYNSRPNGSPRNEVSLAKRELWFRMATDMQDSFVPMDLVDYFRDVSGLKDFKP